MSKTTDAIAANAGLFTLTSNIAALTDNMGNIRKQQEMITKMLLDVDGRLLHHVENPTYEMMLAAVKQNGMAIKHIIPMRQTEELKHEAIKSNPYCFEHINEPDISMWKEAVKFEYDGEDENVEKHPIHLLKDAKDITDPVIRISIYSSFIDANPECFADIISDVSSEKDPDVITLVWKYALLNDPDENLLNECPSDVMEKLVDEVINKHPYALMRLHMKYWTVERTKKLLTAYPYTIGDIPRNAFVDDELGDIYRYVADTADRDWYLSSLVNAFSDIPEGYKDMIFPHILDSTKVYTLIDKGLLCNRYYFNRDKAEYVINKFGFENLCENIKHEALEDIIQRLSFTTRIKYKYKMWRYMKKKKKEAAVGENNNGH